MSTPPRPMCFVAMPFGRKAPPGQSKPEIDFDAVWSALETALQGSGLEPHRADAEPSGGFIHGPMYERLMVAEYVVADLTFANPNVAYEVGIRHGASRGTTLLICGSLSIGQLPFDFRPLRVLPYKIEPDGTLTPDSLARLQKDVTERLQKARSGEIPGDNPILQVTRLVPNGPPAHEKTDVFLRRMQYVNETARRISEALGQPDAVEALDRIRDELLASDEHVAQLHTTLLALYLGYREKAQYQRMVDLFSKLPVELQRTPVAREQLGLALNRLAEAAARAGDRARAGQYRTRAIREVEELPEHERSSETFGILGRIYKGRYDAELAAGDKEGAQASLGRAIEIYEDGFREDPRDYYPGVNAVTLRAIRNTLEDEQRLKLLTPAVRFAVERAKALPLKPVERYWREATRLELACVDRDYPAAQSALRELRALRDEPWMQPWMYGTTAANLIRLRGARANEQDALHHLTPIIEQLQQTNA